MKMKIEVTGDINEDKEELNIFFNASKIWSDNWDAKSMIRSRLKNLEDVTEDEEEFLSQLLDQLSQYEE